MTESQPARRKVGRRSPGLMKISRSKGHTGTFCQVPTTSYISGIFCQLPLTFRASAVPSINFQQLFVHPQDLPKTITARPQNLPSISVDFPCIYGTYRNLVSTFREAGGSPVNFPSGWLTFRQVFLCPRDLSMSFNFPLLLDSSSSSTEFPTPNS